MELLPERDKLLVQHEQIQDLAANDDAAKILSKPVILLDGGLGTTLEDQHEVQFSTEMPLWSSHLLIDEPETLLATQTTFSRNGADVLLTATYQASYEGFANTEPGYSRTAAAEYMRSAVRITKFAIGSRKGLVALSLGAYGAVMLPSQEYTGAYGEMVAIDKLYHWHLDRIKPFREVWTEIDLVAFETLPRLSEIQAVRKVMKSIPAIKPYWISCVFPGDDNLPDGSTVKEVTDAMLMGDRPPFAVGINCTQVGKLPGLIKQFEETAANLPRLVIYPNNACGQTYESTSQKWVGNNNANEWDKKVFQVVKEVYERGRWQGILVGGCCKTRPRDISSLKKRIDELLNRDHEKPG